MIMMIKKWTVTCEDYALLIERLARVFLHRKFNIL